VFAGWLLLAALPCLASATPAGLLDAGKADELLRMLEPQAEGNNAVALNELGRTYYALRDWDNAVRFCEHAARLEPSNATYQLWLARAYGEKANDAGPLTAYALARKSLAAFENARSLDRQSVPIARDLGEYYADAPSIVGGGAEKARALASEIAAAHPVDAAWLRARAYDGDKDYARAEAGYNELIRLDHGSAASYLHLARFLRGRKNWPAFEQAVSRALSSSQISPIDRYDAAELLLRTKRDLAEAARQMRAYLASRTIEEGPAFRAHYLLGEILLASGERAQATAEFKAALALASGYRPAAEALEHMGGGTK
jgi:tetratricopeptide (TPR) repeat protein